jgi:hypothetical protein
MDVPNIQQSYDSVLNGKRKNHKKAKRRIPVIARKEEA